MHFSIQEKIPLEATQICVRTDSGSVDDNIMAAAGVDTNMFKQHSTRGASAAWLETGSKKLSVAQISTHTQWSNLTTSYRKFYHKVVLHIG